MNLGFGDSVECIVFGEVCNGFIIGEALHSTLDKQIVVIANEKIIGMNMHGHRCTVTGAGYHNMARHYQERYLARFPNDLLGFAKKPDPDRVGVVRQIILDWFYPSGGDRYHDCQAIAEEIIATLEQHDKIT
jgi:hypothetical protein